MALPAPLSDSGMTLVEALMAVFLLALASSVIVLSAPSWPSPLETDARKITEMAEAARGRALISGAWESVKVDKTGYASGSLRVERFADGVHLKAERDREELEVLLQFGPTGTAQAHAFTLENGRDSVTLRVASNGAIEIGDVR